MVAREFLFPSVTIPTCLYFFHTALVSVEATLSYEASGKKITFNSTDVPPEFQGKGVGKLLAQVSSH